MKMPPRRILRSIVEDAILDREEFDDPECADRTKEFLAMYRTFLPRLSDDGPAMTDADRQTLAYACMHARIWREGYVESWAHTGEKAIILAAKQDVERITRTEESMGVVRHWSRGGPEPEGMRSVSIHELRKSAASDGWTTVGFGPGADSPFGAM